MALLEEIAYDAALRALDKQEALVGELRSRSGVLLAVASVAIPFASRTGVPPLALVAYAVAVVCGVLVMLPRANLRFSLHGPGVIDAAHGPAREPSELYRRLAFELDDLRTENELALKMLLRAYRLGSAALVWEIASLGLLSPGSIA